MRATVEYVQQCYDRINAEIFAGRLPRIPILLGDASSYLGKCHFKTRRLPNGRKENFDFSLRINTRIDLDEAVVQDTIIHEMIHFFIGVHNLADTSAHGAIFKALMESINAEHGRHITITHKLDSEQRQQAKCVAKWHAIAVVKFTDGRLGIKVLPRVEETIMKYYNAVRGLRDVANIRLYLHNHPLFNNFPSSGSLKVYHVEPETLNAALVGARELIVENGHLRVS